VNAAAALVSPQKGDEQDRHNQRQKSQQVLAAQKHEWEWIEAKDQGAQGKLHFFVAAHRPRIVGPYLNDAIVGMTVKYAAFLGPKRTVPAQNPRLPDEKEEECVGRPTDEIPAISGPDDSGDDDGAKWEKHQ